MVKLSKSERNKLEKAIRAKHGNLKLISEKSNLSTTTLKNAYKGLEVSVETYGQLKAVLPILETLN
jgi:hypothetical protein